MVGQTFYWLAVFGMAQVIAVEQPVTEDPGIVSMDEMPPPPHNQIFHQQFTRTGTTQVSPGQLTEDVIKAIVTGCRQSGDIPAGALLVNVVLLPNVLVRR